MKILLEIIKTRLCEKKHERNFKKKILDTFIFPRKALRKHYVSLLLLGGNFFETEDIYSFLFENKELR